jgi:hypothetical protein
VHASDLYFKYALTPISAPLFISLLIIYKPAHHIHRTIKTTDEIRVRIDKVDIPRFYPVVGVKKGDSIRIIIEKV